MTAQQDVRDLAHELRRFARASGDGGGHFAAMYAGVTERVAARIDAGAFEDGRRMAAFTCAFAERYLGPRSATAAAPACWEAAFAVDGDRSLLVVQHLLVGINAHVNFDLAQAVVVVADREGDLAAAREDFDAINDVLASQQRMVLPALGRVARWVNAGAAMGGGRLFNFSLERARDQAWSAAERLWRLDQEGRSRYVVELDRLVAVLAYLITQPQLPLSLVLPLLRRLEDRDPVRVTGALLRA